VIFDAAPVTLRACRIRHTQIQVHNSRATGVAQAEVPEAPPVEPQDPPREEPKPETPEPLVPEPDQEPVPTWGRRPEHAHAERSSAGAESADEGRQRPGIPSSRPL
jgi:hypothetical protein